MAAKKRKCATPKCRGNALNTERWCVACRRALLKNMRESGYLTDTSWIDAIETRESRRLSEVKAERTLKIKDSGVKERRFHREFPATQLTGALLPSGKRGKKK